MKFSCIYPYRNRLILDKKIRKYKCFIHFLTERKKKKTGDKGLGIFIEDILNTVIASTKF